MKKEVQLTAKSLTIDDLQDSDNIGMSFSDKTKGHIVYSRRRFIIVSDKDWHTDENGNYSSGGDTIKDAILNAQNCCCRTTGIYRFDTRKELYQWLVED